MIDDGRDGESGADGGGSQIGGKERGDRESDGGTGSGINRQSYDAIAARWDSARISFHGSERRYLDVMLEGLAPPARILDLGCGTGRPMAEYVLSRGHQVTGVDQSEELLALARARFPKGEWIHSRIEDFPIEGDRNGAYHGAIAWDSLFHIERERHEKILAKVHGALAPGALLMLTAGGSAHPAFTDTMFDREFFYDSHPPEQLAALLVELGFEIVLNEFMNLPTAGRDKGRIAIIARATGQGL